MSEDLETHQDSSLGHQPEAAADQSREGQGEKDARGDAGECSKEGELGLKTPTSIDHKIPAVDTCPPAPRKKLPREISDARRKRKLSHDQLTFFEATRAGRDEVESFFGGGSSGDADRSRRPVKRRRRCSSA